MKVAFEVRLSTKPSTAQPPMPKNMMTFCARAKILMPKTTNRKPMMLSRVAIRNWWDSGPSQLAPPRQPMYRKVSVSPGLIASGAST